MINPTVEVILSDELFAGNVPLKSTTNPVFPKVRDAMKPPPETRPTPIVVGIGELLWDCFADGRRPGGAPANVAYHATQLGLRGIICSRVGTDEFGAELIEHFKSKGVETAYVQRDHRHATGRVTVDASRADQPTYTIHDNAAWDHLEFDDSWRNLMARASAVCFGTLAQRSPVSRQAIKQALQVAAGATIVYDVNLRSPWYQREWIERSLHQAHVLKLNGGELRTLVDMLALPNEDLTSAARAVKERFALDLVCVTRAERGCLAVSADEVVDVSGRAVNVADAVGAGDAFTAGLIKGLLSDWPLKKTTHFANAVGAVVTGKPGATPHVHDEFAALLRDLQERSTEA